MFFSARTPLQILPILVLTSIMLFMISSCSESKFKYSVQPVLNPNKIAPLTALLHVNASKPCSAKVTVLGETTIEREYSMISDSLSVPVLGLYPDRINLVVLNLTHEKGTTVDTIKIQTRNVPNGFPEIEVNKVDRANMEEGLHACDTHFANNGKFNSAPIIFDDQGEIRWFVDFSFDGKMVGPFIRLKSGNLLAAGRHKIYEFNMLGKILNTYILNDNYGMHHDIIELADGKLLICVGKRDAFVDIEGEKIQTDSDFVILYDKDQRKIIREWDFAKHLDIDRSAMDYFKQPDWLHMNGVAFVEKDSSIIISARNQGLVKISWEDELEWILSPKRGWGKAGRNHNDFDTKPYLLTAVDRDGKAFPENVQDGQVSAEEFDFSWGPHAPKLMPNGNLIVFDNGSFRNYNNNDNYSRAVEYAIDADKKTVEQVWQYGKDRGEEFFSLIVSDVDHLPKSGNILVTAGYITSSSSLSAKIVEVDHNTGKEVFEATLFLKTLSGNKSPSWGQTDVLYRSERLKLEY